MKKTQNFQNDLLSWYEKSKRDLPWRRTDNPYAIWVSEIMLQQTQVDTVIPYYERWMKKFPSVRTLAKASLNDVLHLWEGLGYYSRARNLHKGAQHVVRECKGIIPPHMSGLLLLPGIGPYTARAIASIAFNEDAAVVDGNVKRVISRIFLMKEESAFQQRADEILVRGRAGDFNQAMMELGAIICTPQNPSCLVCPVQHACKAYQNGLQNEFPPKKIRTPQKNIRSFSAVIWKKGEVLIRQRPSEGLLGGLWEFPTFTTADLTNGLNELKIYVEKHAHVEIEIGKKFGKFNHIYTHLKEEMTAYQCLWKKGNISGKISDSWKWVEPNRLSEFAFSGIAGKVRKKLFEPET
jgi:A/G-specific adenine glycosylase